MMKISLVLIKKLAKDQGLFQIFGDIKAIRVFTFQSRRHDDVRPANQRSKSFWNTFPSFSAHYYYTPIGYFLEITHIFGGSPRNRPICSDTNFTTGGSKTSDYNIKSGRIFHHFRRKFRLYIFSSALFSQNTKKTDLG